MTHLYMAYIQVVVRVRKLPTIANPPKKRGFVCSNYKIMCVSWQAKETDRHLATGIPIYPQVTTTVYNRQQQVALASTVGPVLIAEYGVCKQDQFS